MFGFFDLE